MDMPADRMTVSGSSACFSCISTDKSSDSYCSEFSALPIQVWRLPVLFPRRCDTTGFSLHRTGSRDSRYHCSIRMEYPSWNHPDYSGNTSLPLDYPKYQAVFRMSKLQIPPPVPVQALSLPDERIHCIFQKNYNFPEFHSIIKFQDQRGQPPRTHVPKIDTMGI